LLGLQPYPRTCTDVSSIGLIAARHVQETSKGRARKAAACLRCSRSLRSFARRRCSPVPRVRSCSRRSGAHSLMRPQLPRATAASSPVRPALPIPQPPTVQLARPLELPSPFAAPPFTAGVGPRYITRRPELGMWEEGRARRAAVAGEVERGMWRLERQRGRAGSRAFARLRVRGLTVEPATNPIERLILRLCQIQRLVG